MRTLAGLVLILTVALLTGCLRHPGVIPPENEMGNFTFYVANQSLAMRRVDIRIYIDGEMVVDESFRRHGPWKAFRFWLSEGKHTLKVESTKGGAELERDFEIKDKIWALVIYRYNPARLRNVPPAPRMFLVDFHDKPIAFL